MNQPNQIKAIVSTAIMVSRLNLMLSNLVRNGKSHNALKLVNLMNQWERARIEYEISKYK